MRTALFTNFTDEEFIGYWDGKGKKFPPGAQVWMPEYLARHFAKHLTNRELLRTDKRGNLIYKGGEKMTSPKHPEQEKVFMELFNKAFKLDPTEEALASGGDDVDALINSANKNRQEGGTQPAKGQKQDPTQPQVILPPDGDEDDDSEESFQGKPVETGA